MSIDHTRIDFDTDDPTDPRVRRMRGVAVHGNTPFDVPFMSYLGDNIWQGGCQNGLTLPTEIRHVVSLYPWESYTNAHELDSRLLVRMYDSLDQATEQIDAIASWVNAAAKSGPVLVHCQAGLNRSSLVVARALMLQGMSADFAIAHIRQFRSPACLCNPAFEEYLRSL